MILKNHQKNVSDKPLDENVKQIVLGSLLGDGHLEKISKNARFDCCHNPKQVDYIIWKAKMISKNFKVRVWLGDNGPKYKIYKLSTNSSPLITPYHSLFYIKSNKPKRRWEKVIKLEVLEQLNPLALAVWYCDDGTYTVRDKTCGICTQSFTYEENVILRDYFIKKWEIGPHIQKDFRKNLNKLYYMLVFNTKETDKFLKLIKEFVIDSMVYKLGHISDKNCLMLESEINRYKSGRRKWYYENHDRALKRADKYRNSHRCIINKKRVNYYWETPEKSRESGRITMQKRRKTNSFKVNLINHNYYHRNKDKINKEKRERLNKDSEYRDRKNRLQRESYYRHRESRKERMIRYYQKTKTGDD
jgi:hypothetical protein